MLMCWSAAPLYPHSGASHGKNKARASELTETCEDAAANRERRRKCVSPEHQEI